MCEISKIHSKHIYYLLLYSLHYSYLFCYVGRSVYTEVHTTSIFLSHVGGKFLRRQKIENTTYMLSKYICIKRYDTQSLIWIV